MKVFAVADDENKESMRFHDAEFIFPFPWHLYTSREQLQN